MICFVIKRTDTWKPDVVVKLQKNLLNKVRDNEELDLSVCSRYSDVFYFRGRYDEAAKHEILVEDRSSSWAGKYDALPTSEEYSAETVLLLRNDMAEEWLVQFIRYNRNRNDGCRKEGMSISIVKPDARVAGLLKCLLWKEDPENTDRKCTPTCTDKDVICHKVRNRKY